jgi:hypothetical protein
MKTKIAVLIGCFVFISGCVTPYKPTDEVLRLKSSMSRSEAVDIFRSSLTPKEDQTGFCGGGRHIVEGKVPVMTADGFTVEAWRLGEHISSTYTGNEYKSTYKKDFYVFEFQFDKIKEANIYVNNLAAKGPYQVCLNQKQPDYFIGLGQGLVVYLTINKHDFDSFMAACMVLMPNLKVVDFRQWKDPLVSSATEETNKNLSQN